MQTPLGYPFPDLAPILQPESRAIELSGYYLQGPKEWGGIPPKRLTELAEAILMEERGSKGNSLQQRKIAASALTEVALPVKRRSQTIESRNQHLWLIEVVEDLWKTIIEAEFADLEGGKRRWDDQEEWLRAQMNAAHIPLYRDAVRGHIRPGSRHSTIQELERILRYGEAQRKDSHNYPGDGRINRFLRGLNGELRILLDKWAILDDDHIIIPSTYRGGHGGYRPDSTHDTLIAHVSPEGFSVVETLEVKRRIGLKDLARYRATLAQVDDNDEVTYY